MAFLHASKSGYFPFCLEEAVAGEYGPGTNRPFEMSLEDAMTLYWKYRTVKITGSISGNFFRIDDDETYTWVWTVAGTGSLIGNEAGEQPKMSDQVCNDFQSLTLSKGGIRLNPSPSDPIDISNKADDSITYNIDAGGSVKKTPPNPQEEIKIYPDVNFLADWQGDSNGGGTFFRMSGDDSIPDPEFQIQTSISDGFRIKINGAIYKAPMYVVYRKNISLVSVSGFLLIEGVDERLTE